MRNHHLHAFKSAQGGYVLLIVMVATLVMAIMSIISYSKSKMSLDAVNSSQVNVVLKLTADTAMRSIDSDVLKTTSTLCQPATTKALADRVKCLNSISLNQVFGILAQNSQIPVEAAYCYRPLSPTFGGELFDTTKVSIVDQPNTPFSVSTICQVRNSDFADSRSATMAQYYVGIKTIGCAPGECTRENNSLRASEELLSRKIAKYFTKVVAIAPVFSNATDAQINDCFNKPSIVELTTDGNTVDACFKGIGVPVLVQVQEMSIKH